MRPRMRLRDDSGASLIFALVIVTVFSVVIAALLTFGEASVRNTVALREQAMQTASADGAAQLAINALRDGTFDGTGPCFGSGASASNTLVLKDFYDNGSSPVDTKTPDSAAVTCALDSAHSGSTGTLDPTIPDLALLTTGHTADENGLLVDAGPGRDVRIRGNAYVNSTIGVPTGSLTSDARITAESTCTGAITASPPAQCEAGASAGSPNPAYPPPSASTDLKTIQFCSPLDVPGGLVTFEPGRYNDVDTLDTLNTRCPRATFYFKPGVYYWDFGLNKAWPIDNQYLVAGAPATSGSPRPTITGSCTSPVPPTPAKAGWTAPDPDQGVTFVFGRSSRMRLLNGSQLELCGRYSATGPPIAVYGLAKAVGSVLPQSGCVLVTGTSSSACPVISTDGSVGSRFYVHGTTYLPQSAVDIAVDNPSGMIFDDGVIVRSLRLRPTATANLSGPLIGLPNRAVTHAMVDLTVYLCRGTNTCGETTGTRRLRVKVGLGDPSGVPVAGARQVTVYNWSVLR
jgi:hypothetical protein